MSGIKTLFVSRKFWLVLIALVVAAVMYAQGLIPVDKLVDAIVALCAVLIGTIAYEDAAKNASNDNRS